MITNGLSGVHRVQQERKEITTGDVGVRRRRQSPPPPPPPSRLQAGHGVRGAGRGPQRVPLRLLAPRREDRLQDGRREGRNEPEDSDSELSIRFVSVRKITDEKISQKGRT